MKQPEGGAYTNNQRALQGASPYLVNADLTYSPRFGEEKQLSIALLYNLQGPRIHSVGISRLGDIKQQPLPTLTIPAGITIMAKNDDVVDYIPVEQGAKIDA